MANSNTTRSPQPSLPSAGITQIRY